MQDFAAAGLLLSGPYDPSRPPKKLCTLTEDPGGGGLVLVRGPKHHQANRRRLHLVSMCGMYDQPHSASPPPLVPDQAGSHFLFLLNSPSKLLKLPRFGQDFLQPNKSPHRMYVRIRTDGHLGNAVGTAPINKLLGAYITKLLDSGFWIMHHAYHTSRITLEPSTACALFCPLSYFSCSGRILVHIRDHSLPGHHFSPSLTPPSPLPHPFS